MIKRFTFGNPVNTDAVVVNDYKEAGSDEPLPFFKEEGDGTLIYKMTPDDRIYGLGEALHGINKRNHVYESWCTDEPQHNEDKLSLYGAHNFLMVDGMKDKFGIFADDPGRVRWDTGEEDRDILKISFSGSDRYIYIITPDDTHYAMKDISRQFRHIIGKSYVPPLWAFGYGQSRWGYKTEDDIRKVLENYRKADIPIDMIYMDIDYMDHYKNFTVDSEKFPDMKNFVSEMKKENIHLVPIVDAGIKEEKGYEIYEEGLKENRFVKKEDGTVFTGAVWPGRSVFPDFLNRNTRLWFGRKYKFYTDMGIDGFWNDMNEPAIFYSPEGLKKVTDKTLEIQGKNLDIDSYFEYVGIVSSIKNSEEDYRRFCHALDDGSVVNHEKVHNLYGMNMMRAVSEAFEEEGIKEDTLIFSRASYIGAHRYGGIWQGDNCSFWSHLKLNFQMMPSLNMCGFIYTGADTGGFGWNRNEELMLRWLAVSVFTPLFRNHSAMGTKEQELYRFKDIQGVRNIVWLRYRLLPFIINEYMKAVNEDTLMFSPLSFCYPEDPRAWEIEDELMLGDNVLLAPVLEEHASGRYVYLPEKMREIRFKRDGNVEIAELSAGDHRLQVPLGEVVIFTRENFRLSLCRPASNVAELDMDDVTYL